MKLIVGSNSIVQAWILTGVNFNATFHTAKYCFGFTQRLVKILQESECDVLKGFQIIDPVKKLTRQWMASIAGFENLSIARQSTCQTTRNNIIAASADEHFKGSIFIPSSDWMLQEFREIFTTLALQAVLDLYIIPADVRNFTTETIHAIHDSFSIDLDSLDIFFEQKAILWKTFWNQYDEKPNSIVETLKHPSSWVEMFSNIVRALQRFFTNIRSFCWKF